MAVGTALGVIVTDPAKRASTSYATLDLRIDYLKAAKPGADIMVVGECVKITRQIIFARGRAYQTSPDEPIAIATGTFMLTEMRASPETNAVPDGALGPCRPGWRSARHRSVDRRRTVLRLARPCRAYRRRARRARDAVRCQADRQPDHSGAAWRRHRLTPRDRRHR